MMDEVLEFGDIILLKFPFTDGQNHKKRPALVLKDFNDGDIIVCRITSQIYNTKQDVFIHDWEIVGLKLRLIEWIAGLNDTKILNEFISLKKSKETDWWDGISGEERSEIEEGLAQADRGEVVSHTEVMEKYKKWL